MVYLKKLGAVLRPHPGIPGLMVAGATSGELFLFDLQERRCLDTVPPGGVPPENNTEAAGGAAEQAAEVPVSRILDRPDPITHVSLTTGYFKRRVLLENFPKWQRTDLKVVTATHRGPDLLVYTIKTAFLATQLTPFCKIALPEGAPVQPPPMDLGGGNVVDMSQPSVFGLETVAASGALWTSVYAPGILSPPRFIPPASRDGVKFTSPTRTRQYVVCLICGKLCGVVGDG